MTHSFWTGGSDAYKSGVHAQYRALLRDLRSKLTECPDESQRREYEFEISQIEAEYKAKLKETKKLLF
ncbi:hypothetical protein [Novipirellula artificiosorum]|uniref:Uncharacterized protein n=1 Tax=Novipirellula artificiosorum TaxID=2528016 RepID=A0A5C6DYE7_9BACT|nr:hypothetical protein [Novipirellula artificiosorum]TWU42463.1 hypothetical protein Poly41_07600 [Novipirellula artificiosorum]